MASRRGRRWTGGRWTPSSCAVPGPRRSGLGTLVGLLAVPEVADLLGRRRRGATNARDIPLCRLRAPICVLRGSPNALRPSTIPPDEALGLGRSPATQPERVPCSGGSDQHVPEPRRLLQGQRPATPLPAQDPCADGLFHPPALAFHDRAHIVPQWGGTATTGAAVGSPGPGVVYAYVTLTRRWPPSTETTRLAASTDFPPARARAYAPRR